MLDKKFIVQAFKYGIVGVINSAVTFAVIWILRDFLHTSYIFANVMGYIAGVINSFLWNRNWTFKSKNNWKKEFTKFVSAFLICYALQLGFVLFLQTHTAFDEKIITLLGMVVYTGINFLLNKYLIFETR